MIIHERFIFTRNKHSKLTLIDTKLLVIEICFNYLKHILYLCFIAFCFVDWHKL